MLPQCDVRASRMTCAVLLTFVVHSELHAQGSGVDPSISQRSAPSIADALRHKADQLGLWATLGIGRASAGLSCSACANESTRAYVLDGAVGVRLTPRLLMGAQHFAWLDVFGGGVDRISRGTFLVTRLYPSTHRRLFLDGGVGVAAFRIYDDEAGFTTQAPSLSLAVGYDWRVGTVILTPTIATVASTGGDLRSSRTSNTVSENARLTMLRTSVSFSWFR